MTCTICELERCACRIETAAHLERALLAITRHCGGNAVSLTCGMRRDGAMASLGTVRGPLRGAYVSARPSLSDALTAAVAAWWEVHGGGS